MKVTNDIKYIDTLTPFEVCTINKQKFAIFLDKMTDRGNLQLELKDYHIIVLAPVQATGNINIVCRSFTAFSNVQANYGNVSISATSNITLIGADILSKRKTHFDSPE